MLEALIKKWQGEIAVHEETIKIYVHNSVGIGEHPQHAEEMETIIGQIADLQDKIEIAERLSGATQVL